MKNFVLKIIALCFFSSFLIQPSIVANEIDSPVNLEHEKLYGREFKPNFQLGISLGMRIGEAEHFAFSPSAGLNFYYNLSPVVAIKTEFGYANNEIKKFNQKVSIFQVGTHIRLKDMRRVFSSFIELGVVISWHRFKTDPTENTGAIGAKLSVGIELKLPNSLLLDFSFSKIFHPRGGYVLASGVPCAEGVVCKSFALENFMNNQFLNPAYLEMQLRFNL